MVGPFQEVCLLSPNTALQQLKMVFGQVYLQAEIKRHVNNGLMLNTGSVITSRLYLLYRHFQFISKRIYGIDMLFEKQMMSQCNPRYFISAFTINTHAASAGKVSEEQWICQVLSLSPRHFCKGR